MADKSCPLCDGPLWINSANRLYGTLICARCSKRFYDFRCLAYLIDMFVAGLCAWGISLLAGLTFSASTLTLTPVGFLATGAFWICFVVLMMLKDAIIGRSPGKRVMHLRVVDATTLEPITLLQSVKRNLIVTVPYIAAFLLGTLRAGQRPGDRWANTRVIWNEHQRHPIFIGDRVCVNCDYNLMSNTTGVCPECGTRLHRRSPPPVAASPGG